MAILVHYYWMPDQFTWILFEPSLPMFLFGRYSVFVSYKEPMPYLTQIRTILKKKKEPVNSRYLKR